MSSTIDSRDHSSGVPGSNFDGRIDAETHWIASRSTGIALRNRKKCFSNDARFSTRIVFESDRTHRIQFMLCGLLSARCEGSSSPEAFPVLLLASAWLLVIECYGFWITPFSSRTPCGRWQPAVTNPYAKMAVANPYKSFASKKASGSSASAAASSTRNGQVRLGCAPRIVLRLGGFRRGTYGAGSPKVRWLSICVRLHRGGGCDAADSSRPLSVF